MSPARSRTLGLLCTAALGCALPSGCTQSEPAVEPHNPAPTIATLAPARSSAPAPVASARPAPRWRDEGLSASADWPSKDPRELGFDLAALADLVEEAERTDSDSLLILKDGGAAVERYFGKKRGPIELMSVTKSMASIAIGMLIEEKKIAS